MGEIRVVDTLENKLLQALFQRRILAIRVPNFCESSFAREMADWFCAHEGRENYRYSHASQGLQPSETERVGVTANELFSVLLRGCIDPKYADAISVFARRRHDHVEQFRQFCRPRIGPIEELRLILDEIWPSGAMIARFKSIHLHSGVARIETGRRCEPSARDPHVDWLPSAICPLAEQFSAIVYLRMPKSGGELELWEASKRHVLCSLREDGTLDRSALPSPTIVKPEVGDLIIINTRQPHGVRAFASGIRVVQSSFIGFHDQEPLVLWS